MKIDADYNANLVIAESKMRWDHHFGLFIFVPPPINFTSFILMPILLLCNKYIDDKHKLKKINSAFTKITYFPIGLALYLLYLLVDILLLPLSYFKGLILVSRISNNGGRSFGYVILWSIFGVFILLIHVVMDTVKYFRLLYFKNDSFSRGRKT